MSYTAISLPAEVEGILVRDILFSSSEKNIHIIITFVARRGFAVIYAYRLMENRTGEYFVGSKREFRAYSLEGMVSWLKSAIRCSGRLLSNLGYVFVGDYVDTSLASSSQVVPQFVQDYVQPGSKSTSRSRPLPRGKAKPMNVKTKAPRKPKKILSEQDWLKKHHPELSSLPEWEIPLAMRV